MGASARPASFGRRVIDEISKSASKPEIHLVNPGYSSIDGRRVRRARSTTSRDLSTSCCWGCATRRSRRR